jgi:hypothetical protein
LKTTHKRPVLRKRVGLAGGIVIWPCLSGLVATIALQGHKAISDGSALKLGVLEVTVGLTALIIWAKYSPHPPRRTRRWRWDHPSKEQ